MKTFSIAEIEQYSLIKAHTFRTWEKRYSLFKSNRSEHNIRYYTLDDLSLILDFALLNRFGYKVSDLAKLEESAIREKISDMKGDTARQEHQINQLLLSMFACDIEVFESVLDLSVAERGIDQTVDYVILPFLERLEMFCYSKHTSYEYHLAVTALRRKLVLSVEQARPQTQLDTSVMLCLPEGEHFDLLLLHLAYQLKKWGFKTIYLGTNMSTKNLAHVMDKKRPHYLLMYIPPKSIKNIKGDVQTFFSSVDCNAFIVSAKMNELKQSFSNKAQLLCYSDVLKELASHPKDYRKKEQAKLVTMA